MPKRHWKAHLLDDSPVMQRGDTYILLTRKSDDEDRVVEVSIGDHAALCSFVEDLVRWRDRDPDEVARRRQGQVT